MDKIKNLFLIHLPILFIIVILSIQSFLIHSTLCAEIPKALSVCNLQRVSRVIDGDTFELSDGTRIRLLGVDTPETVDPRMDVEWFGIEASKKLKEWIAGQTVCLKQDRDRTQDIDKYGRLLRYVWKYDKDSEGFFINAEIIKQGYGFVYTRYPFQYLEEFRRYEREAREKNLGLWNKERYEKWSREIEKNRLLAKTCMTTEAICPEDAINYKGEVRTVRFFVKKSYDSGRAIYLNSKNNFKDPDNFTAVILNADKDKFPPNADTIYLGKTIEVTGKIREYKGRAEMVLTNKDQIKIIQ
jgi:micrococcal nuclease